MVIKCLKFVAFKVNFLIYLKICDKFNQKVYECYGYYKKLANKKLVHFSKDVIALAINVDPKIQGLYKKKRNTDLQGIVHKPMLDSKLEV